MKRNTTSGFTLLEILVSFGLLTILVLALSMLFRAGTAAFKKGYDTTQVYQSARIALDRMVRELSSAYATYSEGTAPIYTFEGKKTGTQPGTAGPEVYFMAPAKNTGDADLAEVGYWLKTADNSLMRYTFTANKSDMTGFGSYSNGSSDLLASNVVSLTVEYYDGAVWSDTWTSTYAAGLPQAVRITIKTADDDTIKKYKSSQTELLNHAKTFTGIAKTRNRPRAVDQLKIDQNTDPEYP
jgi:Tfp pilus assembly protein PilV